MTLENVKRVGQRLIKYKLNDNKHLFLYKVGSLYYSFIMNKGILVNDNDKEIINTNLKGRKNVGKFAFKYYNSSLNEYYNENNKEIFV